MSGHREYIRVLEQKSQRLKQLTEDLIEASKISSGNIELHPTEHEAGADAAAGLRGVLRSVWRRKAGSRWRVRHGERAGGDPGGRPAAVESAGKSA